MKFDIKQIGITIFLAYIVVTILNYLAHMIYPGIGIFKTGTVLILLLVSIVIIQLFVLSSDGNFSPDDFKFTLLTVALMVGIYFIIKHFIPELFSALPFP